METGKRHRKTHSVEFKASVVFAGLSKEISVTELCRRKCISVSLFYDWRNRFIGAGTASLERRKPKRQIKRSAPSKARSVSRAAASLAVSFQKFRSNQAQITGRMKVPERLKAIELVESASVPKCLAINSIGVAKSSYYRWCQLLRENGSLEDYVHTPEYRKLTEREDVKEIVFKVLHAPPSDFGFNRTTWRQVDLQVAIENRACGSGSTRSEVSSRTLVTAG